MGNFRDMLRTAAIGMAIASFIPGVGAIKFAVADTVLASDESIPQPAANKSDKKDEIAEIVVTGSRIARPDLERLQPTTIISSDLLDKRQFTNVIDALSELPAFGEPDSSLVGGASNGFGSQSFANYFGLGSQRTLTLVDGRRFVPENSPSIFGATGSGGEQVDLNIIPTELIDRVETISIGGAPIYGSDAIAGTVNIILKHNYEGLKVDAQGGTSDRGDASQNRVRLLAGKNFDDGRGNIEFNAELANTGELRQSQRQDFRFDNAFYPSLSGPYAETLYANTRLASITTSGVPLVCDGFLNLGCINSAGSANPLNPTSGIYKGGQLLSFNSAGHLAPYTLGTPNGVDNIGGDGLDFSQIGTLQSPQQRINVTSLGNFQVNDNMRAFGEVWYSETHTSFPIQQGGYNTGIFAPAGQVAGNLILNANNPFLSPQDQSLIAQNLSAFNTANGLPASNQFYLSRLNEDIQNGGATNDQNTKRFVLGIDGTVPIFGRDFKYEVSGNYGETADFSISPSINVQNYQNALNAVIGPNGKIVCAPGYVNSPVPTGSSTCAPFNPFGTGNSSPAASAYVSSLATATSTLTQRVFNASLNGDLFSLPAGAVKIAVGYENRRESADFEPDQFYQQAAGESIPILPISGSFLTNEVFSELLVPVVSPAEDIPFVHRIEIEAAAREVDHSVAGNATTWTAGLRFEPVSILQFRGNYTRSIRSPSITEAFNPTVEAFSTAVDPCDSANINSGPNPSVRAANCAKAGVPTKNFSSNIDQFTEPTTVSGNPNLGNEIADSRTVGFSLRPTARTSFTVDYVSIDIEQAIVNLSATDVLDACYDSPNYPNSECSNVTRVASGSQQGQITLVKTGYANAGFEDYNGIQSEFDWGFDLPSAGTPGGLGSVDVRLNYSFTNRLVQAVGSEDALRLAGELGNSRNKATLDIAWNRNQLYALWQTRFTGHAVFDNALLGQTPTNTQIQGVGNWWVHNITLGYDVDKHINMQLVVNNVFDRQAPFPLPAVPQDSNNPGGTATYFPGYLGRYFIASAAYKF
jgi:iron complex outermembrane receptor protein